MNRIATDGSSNRDSKDEIGSSIVDFSVLNGIKLYLCILDFRVSFLFIFTILALRRLHNR